MKALGKLHEHALFQSHGIRYFRFSSPEKCLAFAPLNKPKQENLI